MLTTKRAIEANEMRDCSPRYVLLVLQFEISVNPIIKILRTEEILYHIGKSIPRLRNCTLFSRISLDQY